LIEFRPIVYTWFHTGQNGYRAEMILTVEQDKASKTAPGGSCGPDPVDPRVCWNVMEVRHVFGCGVAVPLSISRRPAVEVLSSLRKD
jgi:hypothetical protein